MCLNKAMEFNKEELYILDLKKLIIFKILIYQCLTIHWKIIRLSQEMY